ncbi:hypothetical protein VHARVF571_490022 [Vibrio harveyi]|nr:hypothetical protein VHARVF571_490022 [Vibrio harveyi]
MRTTTLLFLLCLDSSIESYTHTFEQCWYLNHLDILPSFAIRTFVIVRAAVIWVKQKMKISAQCKL